MWHGKIFYGKCYLVVVWHSSRCKIVKVIKLFKRISSKDSGRFCHDNYNLLLLLAELSRARSGAPWARKFGNLCIREILVVSCPYSRPPASLRASSPIWASEHFAFPNRRACSQARYGNPNATQGFIWKEIALPPGLLKRTNNNKVVSFSMNFVRRKTWKFKAAVRKWEMLVASKV